MVVSRINNKISYDESQEIHVSDMNCKGELLKTKVHDILVGITVGKRNDIYIKDGIVFFPIYLYKNNNKCIQIGVYEIEKNKRIDFQSKVPLIFDKITPNFLKKNRFIFSQRNTLMKMDTTFSEENVIQDYRIPYFSLMVGKKIPVLNEETFEEVKSITSNFSKNRNPTWLQSFFKNNHYIIQDTDDEEIFYTIRNAFLTIGQETTVTKLREIVVSNVKEELFRRFHQLYQEYSYISTLLKEKIKKVKTVYEDIEKRIKTEVDYENKVALLKKTIEIKNLRNVLVRQQETTQRILKNVRFIKDVTNFKQFKTKLRTSSYPTEWCIEILENVLNIKCIMLSSRRYYQQDLDNVFVCSSDINIDDKYFEPDYYIIMDEKFRLICYKGACIFTHKELPYDLKKIIINKCMEQKTIFNFIPEFIATKPLQVNTEDNLHLLCDAQLYDLFDERIEFIHSPTASDEIPGKLGGEKIPNGDMKHFLGLPENWRKKMSNDWIDPFIFDNRRWASVTHLYEALKHRSKPEYLHYSLDSGNAISSDVLLAKKYLKVPDADFEKNKNEYLQQALWAKWKKDEYKSLLIATKKATLLEFKRGQKPIKSCILMNIRRKLNLAN
uniref:NADAR domain-containing protein n=1 Tax=viral metagenome TaxID=1070528 RepID=A0A6C0HRA2_9ZZZZ